MWFFWLIIEILDWFFQIKSIFSEFILIGFFVILLLSTIYALYDNRPILHFQCKIKNKDVWLWIKIWNILGSSTLVIPINNKFDCKHDWVATAKSVLNNVITTIYDWNCDHLVSDLSTKINILETHPMWTCVPIEHKSKKMYFLANTHLNENNRATSSIDDFYDTINNFFYNLSHSSDKEESISIPLINSWHWRITKLDRNTIIKEIIYLFIENSKSKVICDKLTIYIHPNDIEKGNVDIDDIIYYLKYNAEHYRDIIVNDQPVNWTGISTIQAIIN